MSWDRVLRQAAAALSSAGVPEPVRDARRLLAHVLGCDPARLSLLIADPAPNDLRDRFEALIARRSGREPVSHLIGERAFFGRSFAVTPEVLDPRPETETLIALALTRPWSRVLDLGTGSGCILLTLLAERPAAAGFATDLSDDALTVARGNATTLGVACRAAFGTGDWFDAVPPDADAFDLIVSNPPYIAAGEMAALSPELKFEPRLALTDEADGLSAYRRIIRATPVHLVNGGTLMVEIGPTQGPAVAALCAEAGFVGITVHPDLDGRDRVVSGSFARN